MKKKNEMSYDLYSESPEVVDKHRKLRNAYAATLLLSCLQDNHCSREDGSLAAKVHALCLKALNEEAELSATKL